MFILSTLEDNVRIAPQVQHQGKLAYLQQELNQ